MHVRPGRLVVNLWLDIGDLVSVQVILTLIPPLFQQPVVGSRRRLIGAVHFLELKSIF